MGFRSIAFMALCALVVAKPQFGGTNDESKYNALKKKVETSAQIVVDLIEDSVKEDNVLHQFRVKDWEYQTHMDDRHKQEQVDAAMKYNTWRNSVRNQANSFKDLTSDISNPELKRKIDLFSRPHAVDLPEPKLKRFYNILAEMSDDFSGSTVCKNLVCGLHYKPEIEEEFRTNKDYEELKRMWLGWRRATGKRVKTNFKGYVELANEGAKSMGYTNKGQMTRYDFESPNTKADTRKMMEEMKPLYEQLHAYTRGKLQDFYGRSNIGDRDPIPAHILGDMYGESWEGIYDIVEPYTNAKPSLDVSETLRKTYDSKGIYKSADKFFTKMGLQPLPESFFRDSVFEKPLGRSMDCISEAYDFNNGQDYRVMECVRPSMKQMMDAFTQLGRIQYAMQYKKQPTVFKKEPHPAFPEGIGKAFAMSAQTPEYLYEENLLPMKDLDQSQNINYLMRQALTYIPKLPFSYMLENWRWALFEDKINFESMNCEWALRRQDLQGIIPPSMRTSEDFDAGGKQEVITDEEYMKNFMSTILQFQFYKGICQDSNNYRPGELHKCNFARSTEAGRKLGEMMRQGASTEWRDALYKVTGEREISTEAMREYFKPLEEWLVNENRKNQYYVGWDNKDVSTFCTNKVDFSTQQANQQRSDFPHTQCTYVRTPLGTECL